MLNFFCFILQCLFVPFCPTHPDICTLTNTINKLQLQYQWPKFPFVSFFSLSVCHQLHVCSSVLTREEFFSNIFVLCLFYVMFRGAFPVRVSVHSVCVWGSRNSEFRSVHQNPWTLSSGWFWATVWILGSEPRSSVKAPTALNCEPSL